MRIDAFTSMRIFYNPILSLTAVVLLIKVADFCANYLAHSEWCGVVSNRYKCHFQKYLA